MTFNEDTSSKKTHVSYTAMYQTDREDVLARTEVDLVASKDGLWECKIG